MLKFDDLAARHRAAIEEVRRQHGPGAFVDCREGVAQHEAGHAVVAASESFQVASVELFAAPVPALSAGSLKQGFRLGQYRCFIDRSIDADSDPISDLRQARVIAAGRAAEELSPYGRPDAAQDEVTFSKTIAEIAARKLGVDAEELWTCAVWRPALATCRLNGAVIDGIARRLLRRGVVDGSRLEMLLRGVRRPAGIFS